MGVVLILDSQARISFTVDSEDQTLVKVGYQGIRKRDYRDVVIRQKRNHRVPSFLRVILDFDFMI